MGNEYVYYKKNGKVLRFKRNEVKDNLKYKREDSGTGRKWIDAYLGDTRVATADYRKDKEKDGKYHIMMNMIKTEEDYRRLGIATELYKKIQKETPNRDILFGELTDDGKKLVDNIGTSKVVGKMLVDNENGRKYVDIYTGRINLDEVRKKGRKKRLKRGE